MLAQHHFSCQSRPAARAGPSIILGGRDGPQIISVKLPASVCWHIFLERVVVFFEDERGRYKSIKNLRGLRGQPTGPAECGFMVILHIPMLSLR